ncbi:PTS sugar transporter subunit IIA [Alteromonas macleodii]|uniref:PTS system glucose-specific EIIA component n=1 Tax=Alteromonas macleodii TaxID=28108 RepID=A0A6T9Y214_ALTMA|nr:PTS glucose transporter subunit IIA [Alteromonas macleodii]CAB9493467.1 Phosphotransferase system IIA component [Alteromonas macleodii]
MKAKQLQCPPESFAKQFVTLSPFSGQVVSLSDIDDPFYKNGLMGPGAAISSNSNTVISPFAGKVINISPLDYAIDIQSTAGLKCKIKYGGDTTSLHGAQFVCALKRGEQIKPKQVLFTVNAAWLKQRGVSNTCALTLLNAQALIGVLPTHQKFVEAGEDTLLTLYL